MAKARRFTKSDDSEKSFINVHNPVCLSCGNKLRSVLLDVKLKCDQCGTVYGINSSTGEVLNKFKSFVRSA